MGTVRFKIFVSVGYLGCDREDIIEIDEEDLKGIPEDEHADYVWDELGGKEVANDMLDMGCTKI